MLPCAAVCCVRCACCSFFFLRPKHTQRPSQNAQRTKMTTTPPQARFNAESKGAKLELVLFTDALAHLARVSRVLAMARDKR